MCGIAALFGQDDPAHEHTLAEALDRIAHRGPDGTGQHWTSSDGPLLGHRRLAIIDPDGGHQPLVAPDGAALVANGMIYNDRALRVELGDEPYRTGSDSESILHLLRRHGADAPARLDGMFSFVYADRRNGGRVVAARDPLGIKPLYRFRLDDVPAGSDGSGVDFAGELGRVDAFASEVKAFDGLAGAVEEFPPGHVYDSVHGLRPYYRVPEPTTPSTPTRQAVAEVRESLEAAVVKRLRSDVPLGCLLSGGLDSSLIAALARRHVPELHTFAVGLAGSDDLAAARRVAAHLDTTHHELVVTPEDVSAVVPDVLWHLESADTDLVRSAIGTWLVMEFASRYVTVVLTGEGADELFAGYAYYADYTDPEQLQAELHRSIGGMHHVNLQRVDRMSMAHGVEARVPFLDTSVVDVAMRTPPALKQRDPSTGRASEKWVIRAVADGLLPEEIVWRRKAQFDEGSGLAELLPRLTGPDTGEGTADRAHEGAVYRDHVSRRFRRPDLVLGVAGTWANDRLTASAG